MAFVIQNPPPMRTPIGEAGGVDFQLTPPWARFFMYLQDQIAAGGGGGGAGARTWSTSTPSGTASVDGNGYKGYVFDLIGPVTVDPPVSPTEGSSALIVFVQDATGGRAVTWDAAWNMPASVVIDSAPNAVSVVLVEFGPTGTAYVVSDRDSGGSGGVEAWAVQSSTGSNITIDHAVSDKHHITVTSNCALDAPINLRPNVPLTVVLLMDSTGWTVTPDAAWKLPTIGGDILPLPDTQTVIGSQVLPAGTLIQMSFVTGVDA